MYKSSIYIHASSEFNLAPVTSLTCYYFYFTGYYPHPSVPPHPGVLNVQKEVVYCPDLKFCAFDIAITSSQQESRSRLRTILQICYVPATCTY